MPTESVWLKWWQYDGNNEELRAVLGRVPCGIQINFPNRWFLGRLTTYADFCYVMCNGLKLIFIVDYLLD